MSKKNPQTTDDLRAIAYRLITQIEAGEFDVQAIKLLRTTTQVIYDMHSIDIRMAKAEADLGKKLLPLKTNV